jgi:hypothetical protein
LNNPPNGKIVAKQDSLPTVLDITEDNKGQLFELATKLKSDINSSKIGVDPTKYQVMEGMQNPDKRQFFSDYENRDDVYRMNTIQRYVRIAPLIIRRCKPATLNKIELMMQQIYAEHVEEHKENVTSLKRGRETAYTKILGADSSDSGSSPTGFRKFFGVGGRK